MIFPVLLKTPGQAAEPEAANLYYLVAENGIFQVRRTPIYRAVTRVAGPVPGLLPEHEQLRLRCPRLPRRQLQEVLAFFAEVYRRHRGEAVVQIFYRDETREYRMLVPPQTLLGRRRHDGSWRPRHAVRYGSVARPPGFVRFGSVHSHADLPAYASGVDCDDERFEDGLHIVFGGFGSSALSIAAAFVVNGVRFPLPPGDVLERCSVPARAPRRRWMARVRWEADGARPAALPCAQSVLADPAPADGDGEGNEDIAHRT